MRFLIRMAFKSHINLKLSTGPTRDSTHLINILILTSIRISEHFTRIKESLNIIHKMKNLNLVPNLR